MKIKKMKLIILLLLFWSFNAYAAEVEKYVVEKPDGSVVVIHYLVGSHDSLEEIVDQLVYTGLPITRVNDSDFPASRADREFWKFSPVGKKIQIDTVKKAEKEAEQAQEEAEKAIVLEKLKITAEEFEKLK